jgi:hypothetical protein
VPNHHWLPQSWYIPEKVNYLGKVEHFDEDFSRLLNLLGISKEFGRLNAVERKDYREYYDSETRKLVERLYWEDIQRFGYTYE